MGFIIRLTIRTGNYDTIIKYVDNCFKTAKILDSNIQPGGEIAGEKEAIFLIDDRTNNELMAPEAFSKFDDWKYKREPFQKENLDQNQLQYLTFEINNKSCFLCLHTGIYDTYCLIDYLPWKGKPPRIEENCQYINSFFHNANKNVF